MKSDGHALSNANGIVGQFLTCMPRYLGTDVVMIRGRARVHGRP